MHTCAAMVADTPPASTVAPTRSNSTGTVTLSAVCTTTRLKQSLGCVAPCPRRICHPLKSCRFFRRTNTGSTLLCCVRATTTVTWVSHAAQTPPCVLTVRPTTSVAVRAPPSPTIMSSAAHRDASATSPPPPPPSMPRAGSAANGPIKTIFWASGVPSTIPCLSPSCCRG